MRKNLGCFYKKDMLFAQKIGIDSSICYEVYK